MGKNLIKQVGFRFTDENLVKKMDVIAKSHKRNRNQETEWALSEYVRNFEAVHGEIQIKTPQDEPEA